MCILVADDDPVVREVVRRYLERDGRTVVETGDGRAAHAVLARTGTPDDVELAVLDVMMPEPSGIDLCRAVRAGRRPDLPIILLTALGDEDDRVLGLEAAPTTMSPNRSAPANSRCVSPRSYAAAPGRYRPPIGRSCTTAPSR